MNQNTLDLFLHGANRPLVVVASLDESLRDVLARADALPGDGQFVFVGERDEPHHRDEDDEDEHDPIDINLTIRQLDLHKHKHVHTRAVRRVEVTVYFNGKPVERKFSPAATIARVTAWAKRRFHIDPKDGADLVLAIHPNGAHPRPDEHLGELLQPGCDSLAFDLLREITPQG